jgi:hypothetical protein
MTKKIRIENADTAPYALIVQTVQKGAAYPTAEGAPPCVAPDVILSEVRLNNPADLAEIYIHSGTYLVVKEA